MPHALCLVQVLSERAHQFRSIQKRLLVRFKDRNPSPLSNLDLLFEDTYRHLIVVSEKVEGNQRQLQATANSLTCATNLMLFLIRSGHPRHSSVKNDGGLGGNLVWVGRNEPAVPSAAVRLGRLGSGGSARRRCRLAGPPEPNRPAVHSDELCLALFASE